MSLNHFPTRSSLLSVDEVLSALERASEPKHVQQVIRRADEATVAKAWSMLSPVQRGALLLTRRFQGSSILQDEEPEPQDLPCATEDAE